MALGNIKTSLSGTHHAFGLRKNAHRYLGQVHYLFNRRFDLRKDLERLNGTSSLALTCLSVQFARLNHLADQVNAKAFSAAIVRLAPPRPTQPPE